MDITLRQLYAGLIMAGMWANPDLTEANVKELAEDAVNSADQLIYSLNETNNDD